MCGIAGIYQLDNARIEKQRLVRFTDSLKHRGPDGSGYELLANSTLGLGHRRLSILDLTEAGKQPMSYANERYWITYNGEIFNFSELKKELTQKGFHFKSDTDTEVIMASYIAWGKDCLNKFNGMWAFALWDSQENELFLSRDRFGIKPLYYFWQPGNLFAFASETRAFKSLVGFQREFDSNLLQLNLDDNYALEGLGYTPFKNISQILPGHYAILKKEKDFKQKRWWHIDKHTSNEIPGSIEEQAEEFYRLFRDACKIRLVSDVPVATALSGGLDSTSVYSTVYDILKHESLARVNKDSQRAFTAIFPGLPDDEQVYAEKAVAFVGGSINFVKTDYTDLAAQISKETELCDFISSSPITSISSVYAGMRKNGIVVSMDGHGVDEMMYGYRDMVYSLYNNSLWEGGVENTKKYAGILTNMYHPESISSASTKFDQHITEKIKRDNNLLCRVKTKFKKSVSSQEYIPLNLPSLSNDPYDFSNQALEERMLYNETFQHTLPALLRNFDRAGMMNSIEIRMPFMDWRLVSYVFSLPLSCKLGQGFTKLLLRTAMKNRMSEDLRVRTFKVGIGSPVEHWFNGVLKEWVMDNIKDHALKSEISKAYKRGVLSPLQVKKVWNEINIDLIK